MSLWTKIVPIVAGSALALTGCAGEASNGSSASPMPTYEMPTASYTPPADATFTPANQITLNSIEPNDGVAPVVDFINSAQKSIDISTYRIDADYAPVVDALTNAVQRGVPVRVSISRQLIGGPNPPEGNEKQVATQQALTAKGIQVELSRPEFHYGHEKAIIIDPGTDNGKVMISDWNLQDSYFGANRYSPVGARGFAVVNTNPEDVAEISRYFDANWPPFTDWPVSNRASLLWSPSGIEYSPVGNGVAALTDFVSNAKTTLDIYAEKIQDNSFMLDQIIDRAKAGVTVRVIANSDGQSQQVLDRLKDAGIEIVFDPKSADMPTETMYVHTKTMIADYGTADQVAFVGSQNQFINESLEAILELGVLIKDPATITTLQETFNSDLKASAASPAPPSPKSSPSPSTPSSASPAN